MIQYFIKLKKKFFLLFILSPFCSVLAQQDNNDDKPEVITPVEFHISKPLREIAENFPFDEAIENDKKESKDHLNRASQTFLYNASDDPKYGNDPSSIQQTMGSRKTMSTITNWAGQSGTNYPPDPSGAAGPNHYIQTVNATFLKVYNKATGTPLLTVNVGSLFGTPNANAGDAIALYDKYADRWFVSQLDDPGSANSNDIHIAISQTSDPTGAYFVYTYSFTQFPDYLKFSIWDNGYYMTSNLSGKICCFERAQMLIGNPSARSLIKSYTMGGTASFFCPLPADADGGLPPNGTGLPFFSYYDNGWAGGADAIHVWTMTVNWGLTPTAIVTGPATLPTAAFDASYSPTWEDIPQPGTTHKLDGIGGVCMFRAQWRKWTTYNSVVLNWGVKISATQRSIKWCELRQDQVTGTWTVYQEGIYSPDAMSRWVGSIAMDDNGGIALCYAISGTTAPYYPSLCFTGRLASDPLGQMTFAESIAYAGTSSQIVADASSPTGYVVRFGDYSHTSLDPVNGLIFWHTGEYIANNNPKTRIYSFKLENAINGNEGLPQVKVYQSGNLLTVKTFQLPSTTDEEYVVDLFDISGKQITGKSITSNQRAFETTIDVHGLATGAYLVRVGSNKFQRVIKIVLN
jgi:hypothetical protein